MPTTVVERWGSLSATGFCREATFKTPLTPSTFLPMTGNGLQLDVGLFSPKVMFGQRDLNTFPLYGQYKLAGSVTGPLFPTNGALLVPGAIGPDAQVGYGVAAPTPTTATTTTLNGSTVAGATTITVASGTGFATGQQVAIDSGGLLEIRKISNVVTTTITLADALTFAHATGVNVVTGAATTTLNGAITAGATTFTATSGAGLATGNFIQVDVNSPSGTTTSEVRKVVTVSVNSVTVDVAFTYGHLTGANVILVTAPYAHNVQQANVLSSFTVEKNLGGFDSLQFSGARVNKLSISSTTTDTEATINADMVAASSAVLDTPTAISITNENPFVFAEGTVSLFNQVVAQATSFSLDIENGLVSTYTYNSSHNLQFLTPLTRRVSGKIDVVFTSLDDATWGYYNAMVNGTTGALQFTLTHPGTAGTVSFYMPKAILKTVPDDVKMESVIMTSLNFEAYLNLSTLQTISALIIDQSYLAL